MVRSAHTAPCKKTLLPNRETCCSLSAQDRSADGYSERPINVIFQWHKTLLVQEETGVVVFTRQSGTVPSPIYDECGARKEL